MPRPMAYGYPISNGTSILNHYVHGGGHRGYVDDIKGNEWGIIVVVLRDVDGGWVDSDAHP